MEILGVILLIWCGGIAVLWGLIWQRVGAMMRDRPTVLAGLDLAEPPDGWPKLSIVIPAHNEQRVIDACASALRSLVYPKLEIIIVLDRCTDATRELLRAHESDKRLIIIENESCPPDWAGKCNAARIGAERATGQWLLFTDADTEFAPDLARAAVALATHRNVGLLSLLSSLTYRCMHERIAQPVATMNLIRMFPLARVKSSKRTRPFANGQFLLFDREWYDRIGGHTAVKDDLLEDIAFARLMHDRGADTAVVMADGMLRCSMYSSLDSFKRGWKRIFIEACRRKPRRLRKNGWRILTLGVVTPLVQFSALVLAAVTDHSSLRIAMVATVAAGLLMQLLALLRIYRLNGAPLLATLAYPLGCWIVGRLMLDGARDLDQRRPVTWGGKQYVLEPRHS